MNQDWRDERVRELFHELGEEEGRLTPGFAGVLEAALRRRSLPRHLRVWRFAAAVALPVVALAAGLAWLENQPTETLPPIDPTIVQRLPGPRGNLYDSPSPVRPIFTIRPRMRKSPSRTRIQIIQISQWRAPTDFLLETPGSEIFRNLPRMPDSPPGIPRSLPDYDN
jgi:hypothetical protein